MKIAAALMAVLPVMALARAPIFETNDDGEIWAVLVAGSNGWYNYRHQSDICHAYQVLKSNGIDDDHIVVMMFDDIANNRQNPYKGKIINHPHGDNVYEGVPKDYTGRQVTVENFRKVLMGDEEGLKGVGSGKVIKSGPNDKIFINMDDHGSPGLFCFPYQNLYASDFVELLQTMKEEEKYSEILVYMESCFSGSMFQSILPKDINVYALSAASPYESSWAAYCSGPLNTCLGDLFSVSWMEDVESKDPTTELISENYKVTRTRTYLSDVMEWGDKSIKSETVATFMGGANTRRNSVQKLSAEEIKASSVPSQDVPVISLQNRLKSANSLQEKQEVSQELQDLLNRRSMVRSVMNRIALEVSSGDKDLANRFLTEKQESITEWGCHKEAVEAFHQNCFNLGQSTYALTVVPAILTMCEAGYTSQTIEQAINSVCTFPTIYNAY